MYEVSFGTPLYLFWGSYQCSFTPKNVALDVSDYQI